MRFKQDVFLRLRDYCWKQGFRFQAIDLRFRLHRGYSGQRGVPAKDLNGESVNSWEYSRQWIDHVEQFLVFLLSLCYGFAPEPRHFR